MGFDIFRFEDDLIVEHWDNLCEAVEKPNVSGHTMTDGTTEITDKEMTMQNKEIATEFINIIMINKELDKLNDYVDNTNYVTHSPMEKMESSLYTNGSQTPTQSTKQYTSAR